MTDQPNEFVAVDTDADGVDDAYAQQQDDGSVLVASDSNADDAIDSVVHLDPEGNLIAVARDLDHQGDVDVEADAESVRQYNNEGQLIDEDVTGQEEVSAAYPGTADYSSQNMVGDPFAKADYWFEQATSGWCGPAAVAQIVAEYTGNVDLHVLEGQVAQVAIDNGWLSYSEGGKFNGWSGMTSADLDSLLDSLGVPSDVVKGDMTTLAQYLAEGREIVVAVDSDETWARTSADDTSFDMDPDSASVYVDDDGTDAGMAPDHFVTVVGIDLDRGVVLLNDPGHPDGELAVIPIEQFDDAWRDSGHEMVVTQSAGPEAAVNASTDDVVPQPLDDSFAQNPADTTATSPVDSSVEAQTQQPYDAPVTSTVESAATSPVDSAVESPVDTQAQDPVQSPLSTTSTGSQVDATEAASTQVPPVVLAPNREFDLQQGGVIVPVWVTGPVAAAGGAALAVLAQRASRSGARQQ